jgi:hypothetical protein
MCIVQWRSELHYIYFTWVCALCSRITLLCICSVQFTTQRRWTWTGDFKCREVKTGFCRKRWTQTGSSGTLISWKSGQTTFIPLWDWWDRMEGAWLWTQVHPDHRTVCPTRPYCFSLTPVKQVYTIYCTCPPPLPPTTACPGFFAA